MEEVEEIVIVGAGVSGLATALGLHRKGIRSLVLESSDSLRAAGFAILTWPNAWRALDALGVGDLLRRDHIRLERHVIKSATTGATMSELPLTGQDMEHETRCLKRNLLLQALVKDLPPGCIRYSSKIVSIEKAGNLKLLHLADGSTIKTKVLVGCDGLNSVVANWLGFRQPTFSGRFACRGLIEDPQNPIMKRHIMEYFLGEGFRFGFSPCNDETLCWFFTWRERVAEEDPLKMRELLMDKLNNSTIPREVIATVEMSDRSCFVAAPLKFRWPFDLLRGNICKDNVCVAGDALHPMTPELGQGACSALEDAVVLARCLGEALLRRGVMEGGEQQFERVEEALREYARGRRWRSFSLVAASYAVGHMQQAAGFFMRFVKEILSGLRLGFSSKLLRRIVASCSGLRCQIFNVKVSDVLLDMCGLLVLEGKN